MACGRSDEWEITQDNYNVELKLNELIIKKTALPQPEWVLNHIHANWIKWAWRNGDETVDEFTGGIPLFKPVVTYHHLCEK
jgi:hypothetical protein